jgi:hypothetical protein
LSIGAQRINERHHHGLGFVDRRIRLVIGAGDEHHAASRLDPLTAQDSVLFQCAIHAAWLAARKRLLNLRRAEQRTRVCGLRQDAAHRCKQRQACQ